MSKYWTRIKGRADDPFAPSQAPQINGHSSPHEPVRHEGLLSFHGSHTKNDHPPHHHYPAHDESKGHELQPTDMPYFPFKPSEREMIEREEYWTVSSGHANRTGWSCRQCKTVINLHEPIIVRDGRKMRFFYHQGCFSGEADPRSQPGSTFEDPIFRPVIQEHAPSVKGHGKWSVASYGFHGRDGSGLERGGSSGGGGDWKY